MSFETTSHITTSRKRVAGAAFFGFVSAAYIWNAADDAIPRILSMAQKINLETAHAAYESSGLLRSGVLITASFAGAVTAGFLGRRKGIVAGLLSSLVYILAIACILVLSVAAHYTKTAQLPLAGEMPETISFQLQVLLRFVLLILAAGIGGLVGQRLYSPHRDLDLHQEKLTVFGIRWAHYFWILPFIYLAFLASLIILFYAAVTTYLADLSFAWHPSLWFNVVWWLLFPLAPGLVYVAAWLTFGGFVRFHEVMQCRQTATRGWGKVGRVFLYGVGAPALSYTVAAIGADIAHAMPKPVQGDWKVAVGLMVLFLFISLLGSAFSWLRASR